MPRSEQPPSQTLAPEPHFRAVSKPLLGVVDRPIQPRQQLQEQRPRHAHGHDLRANVLGQRGDDAAQLVHAALFDYEGAQAVAHY